MAKEETPRVTLVIPARNEEKYISKCLDSVLKQEFQNFETIVVDNGSTDQTAKIVRGYAKDGIKYVYEAEPGLPKARQVGLENAKGDILVNVDADCTIPPNYIGTIAKYFIDNPSVVGLSNPFYFHDGSIGLRGFVKLFFGVFNILSRLKIFRFLFGGSFAVRKSVLNRAGGFNTSIKFWGEDADLSRRIVQEGEIRFLPKLVVWTSARRFNRFGFFKTSYKYVANFFAIIRIYKYRQNLTIVYHKNPKRFLLIIGCLLLATIGATEIAHTRLHHRQAKHPHQSISISKSIHGGEVILLRGEDDYRDWEMTMLFLLLIVFMYSVIEPRSNLFGSVRSNIKDLDPFENKNIALTFDDGPNGKYTEEILDYLKSENIKATFFVVGHNVERYPDLARRIVNEGHSIGNHSYEHSWFLPFYMNSKIKAEISKTSKIIVEVTGRKPTIFRPPHGLKTPWMKNTIKQEGMNMVCWDNMTTDWMLTSKSMKIAKTILSRVKPGSIIVLHDGLNLENDIDRRESILALKVIVERLKESGYHFITL